MLFHPGHINNCHRLKSNNALWITRLVMVWYELMDMMRKDILFCSWLIKWRRGIEDTFRHCTALGKSYFWISFSSSIKWDLYLWVVVKIKWDCIGDFYNFAMLNNIGDYDNMWLCHAIHTERRQQRLIGTVLTKEV